MCVSGDNSIMVLYADNTNASGSVYSIQDPLSSNQSDEAAHGLDAQILCTYNASSSSSIHDFELISTQCTVHNKYLLITLYFITSIINICRQMILYNQYIFSI